MTKPRTPAVAAPPRKTTSAIVTSQCQRERITRLRWSAARFTRFRLYLKTRATKRLDLLYYNEVGEPEDSQRRVLERVEGQPQRLAKGLAAPADVIETRKDVGVQPLAQAGLAVHPLKVGVSVRPRVRDEPVADGVGQPVDERHVPEDVALAQEDAVRLERVQPVRAEDHCPPVRPEHAAHLSQRSQVVGDVLDHLVQQDDVERVIGERQVLAQGERQVRQLRRPFPHPLLVYVHAVDLIGELPQAPDERPHAATDVQDAFPLKRRFAPHHLQAALQPARPDLAGMAQGGALVNGSHCLLPVHSSVSYRWLRPGVPPGGGRRSTAYL